LKNTFEKVKVSIFKTKLKMNLKYYFIKHFPLNLNRIIFQTEILFGLCKQSPCVNLWSFTKYPILFWKLAPYCFKRLLWIIENFGSWFEVIWSFIAKVIKELKKQKLENSLNKKKGGQSNWADPGAQQEQPAVADPHPFPPPLYFFPDKRGPLVIPFLCQETNTNTSSSVPDQNPAKSDAFVRFLCPYSMPYPSTKAPAPSRASLSQKNRQTLAAMEPDRSHRRRMPP
jgi:hypothetical protein